VFEDIEGFDAAAVAVVVEHIPSNLVFGINGLILFPWELCHIFSRPFAIGGAYCPSTLNNLVQGYRLVIPIHTTYIVDFIPASDAIKTLRKINLKICFICKMGVGMEMDCLVSMSVVHRGEIMGEDNSFLRAVFQAHANIVVIFDSRKRCLGFCIVQKAVMIIKIVKELKTTMRMKKDDYLF